MDGDINRNQPLFDPQNRIFLSVQSPISPHRQYLGESSSNTMMTQDERRDLSNRLIPVYVNMNRRETMEEHSTIYYNTPELVLRRGQEFSCILLFNQAFQSDKYQLIIVFKSQTWRNFPVIKIPLNESSNGWSVKINDKNDENQKKNQLQLRVCSSPSALIGKYSVRILNRRIGTERFSLSIECLVLLGNSFSRQSRTECFSIRIGFLSDMQSMER